MRAWWAMRERAERVACVVLWVRAWATATVILEGILLLLLFPLASVVVGYSWLELRCLMEVW